MSNKSQFGRTCEDFVAELIAEKTKCNVSNLNDIKNNHPVTDLHVKCEKKGVDYQVSIKAKKSKVWPSVRGIKEEGQYIVFVDIFKIDAPTFYILDHASWQQVLKDILPQRDAGAEIVDGAVEWNWVEDKKSKKFRGSQLFASDIEHYLNNWSVLPGVKIPN